MKKLVSLLVALLMLLGLAGLAIAEQPAEEVEITRNMVGDGKNVVRIVMDGEPFSVKAMQEVLTKFFNETGISVELMFVPSSGGWAGFNSKIQTMIAGGDTPDVIRLAIEGFEVFRSNNLLEPLNPLIEKYPDWAAMVADNNEEISRPLTVDGITYAYGFEWNNIVTHINLNVLREAGLEMPPADWDYDTFLEYAKKMTFTREDGTQVYGMNLPNWYFAMSAWLFNNGASFLNDDMTECVINSPEAKEVFQFLYDLVYVHKVAPLNAGSFIADQVGMDFLGRWPFKTYTESGFDAIDIQWLPTNKSQQAIAGFGLWPISASSTKKDEAFKLICWLSSQDSQRTIIDISGIPMSEEVMKEVVVDTDFPGNSKIFFESAGTAKSVECPPTYNEIQAIFDRYISLIFANEMSIDDALNGMKEEIDLALMGF